MFIILVMTKQSRRRKNPNDKYVNSGMPIIFPTREEAKDWIATGGKGYLYQIFQLVQV